MRSLVPFIATLALLLAGPAACTTPNDGLAMMVPDAGGPPEAAAGLAAPDAAPVPVPDAATPRTPDAGGTRALGSTCGAHGECGSGLCVSMACRMTCSLDRANDCAQAGGPCVPTTAQGVYFCKAEIRTGIDGDNALLQVGDSITRNLLPLDDVDLFLVRLNRLGPIVIAAQPGTGIDLALDVLDEAGQRIGAFNRHGPGQPEAAETTAMTVTGYVFVVVKNVGSSTGAYQLKILGS